MNRREFVACGLAGSLASATLTGTLESKPGSKNRDIRTAFPRMEKEIYLNAASLMPLSTFCQAGLMRYMNYQQLGTQSGERDYVGQMWSQIRKLFATMIGAEEAEIGLVHCTKAGEQIVLDAVDAFKKDGNIVTNDLHFSGSLHNLVGLQKAGRDVRIVRAKNWSTPLDAMEAAIDDKTALVALTLVSNINGHIENIAKIAKKAHHHGALVYADIIQAAGVFPIDVQAMGIDFAACSSYKWLYGGYGAGFFYARKALQGTRLPDRLFPGRLGYNYQPWTNEVDASQDAMVIRPKSDASRYEAGHVNYQGYCGVYEGLKFLLDFGVEKANTHSVQLNQRLKAKLNPQKFICISPHHDRSPIITFLVDEPAKLREKLIAANVVVTLAGNRLRFSPALYNQEGDIDALVKALHS